MVSTNANCSSLVAWVIWILAVGQAAVDAGLYTLREANTTYDEWTDIFTMVYPLDPMINVTDQLRVDILEPNCTYPKLGVPDGVVSDFINASGYHIFEVDPHTMSLDDRLFNYSYWANTTVPNAVIQLCVRAGLWTGPESDPNAAEASSLETIVTLFIDLTEQFYVDEFNVEPKKDLLNNTAFEEESFQVFAYFCDPNTQEQTSPNPIRQGQLVTVCVEITEEAMEKGVYIDYIQDFAWIRNNTYSSDIVQDVIRDAALVDPFVSIYDCVSPLEICDFSMIMYPAFFARAGTAYGVGMARLTFAPLPIDAANGAGNSSSSTSTSTSTTSTRNRNLLLTQQQQPQQEQTQLQQGTTWPYRTLQQQDQEIPDAGSTFGIDMSVVPVEQGRPPLRTAGAVSARTWTSVSALFTTISYVIASATAWIVLLG